MKVFGRKRGYKLKSLKKKRFEKIFPRLNLDSTQKIDKNTFTNLPCNIKQIWLEIGYGSGEHLNWQLENNPNVAFLCCDHYLNGTANLVTSIKEENYERIKVSMEDGTLLLELLPSNFISKAFILFPDPWPKKKHHKRRLINSDTIKELSRVMKTNAELRVATDNPSYCAWILHYFVNSENFIWNADSKEDFIKKPLDWPQTRYEKKALLKGNNPIFLIFTKKKNKHY